MPQAPKDQQWLRPANMRRRPRRVIERPATLAETQQRLKAIRALIRQHQAIVTDTKRPYLERRRASQAIETLAEERNALVPWLQTLQERERQARNESRRQEHVALMARIAALNDDEPVDRTNSESLLRAAYRLLVGLAKAGRVTLSADEYALTDLIRDVLVGTPAQFPDPIIAVRPVFEVPASAVAARERLQEIKQASTLLHQRASDSQGDAGDRKEAQRALDHLAAERAHLRAWLAQQAAEQGGTTRRRRGERRAIAQAEAAALTEDEPWNPVDAGVVVRSIHRLLLRLPDLHGFTYTPGEWAIVDALRDYLYAPPDAETLARVSNATRLSEERHRAELERLVAEQVAVEQARLAAEEAQRQHAAAEYEQRAALLATILAGQQPLPDTDLARTLARIAWLLERLPDTQHVRYSDDDQALIRELQDALAFAAQRAPEKPVTMRPAAAADLQSATRQIITTLRCRNPAAAAQIPRIIGRLGVRHCMALAQQAKILASEPDWYFAFALLVKQQIPQQDWPAVFGPTPLR
jgi:hypothetical protein